MTKLNKGTKTLIKLLEKQQDYIESKIAATVKAGLVEKSLAMPVTNYLLNKPVDQSNFINSLLEDTISKLNTDDLEEFQVLRFVSWVLDRLINQKGFNDFVNLEDLFNFYDFDTKFRLDVLGYVLRTNAECFLRLENTLLSAENEDISEFQEKISKELQNLNIGCGINGLEENINGYLNNPSFRDNVLFIFNNYKTIIEFIEENGEFKANDNTTTFYKALEKANVKLTTSQKKIIIDNMQERFRNQKALAEKIQSKESAVVSEVILKPENKKERWEALQVVKTYLKDDMPIKHISSEEFLNLSSSLITLDYSDEQITKIQKSIVMNNKKLEEEKECMDYNSAKQRYLAASEIEILDQAEELINNPEAINNPIFQKIKDDFYFIREELIKVYVAHDDNIPDLNSDAEIIIWGITELNDGLVNYGHSNYHYSRTIINKDK